MITKDGIVGEGIFVCTTCKTEGVVHTDDGDAMPPSWRIVLDDWDAVVEVFCSQRCLAEWATTGVTVEQPTRGQWMALADKDAGMASLYRKGEA